jgi:L,D-peptidoglycan transpeptidase YkuD (ErfK/YbiS/YcfS/YnhG family)
MRIKARVIALIGALIMLTPSTALAAPSQLAELPGKQAIVVQARSAKSSSATVTLYQKTGDVWYEMKSFPAMVGRNGIAGNGQKQEGDGKTPSGIYELGTMFSWYSRIAGVKWQWRKTTKRDYWIDDAESADYNKWVTTSRDPQTLWKSFERLRINAYKYAMVIEYNTENTVAGAGSAIFLHIWVSKSTPTSGCVAMSKDNLLTLMRWLRYDDNPRIVIVAP